MSVTYVTRLNVKIAALPNLFTFSGILPIYTYLLLLPMPERWKSSFTMGIHLPRRLPHPSVTINFDR
jgi:hypothetical protein